MIEWREGGRGVSVAIIERKEHRVVALKIRVRRRPIEHFVTLEMSPAQLHHVLERLNLANREILAEGGREPPQ